ncbi:unnamed protein product, partial [Prorocentrum cordatum]
GRNVQTAPYTRCFDVLSEKEEKDELSEAGPNYQLTLAMAKLVLQRKDDLRNQRRDVNVVLVQRADTKLQLALEEGVGKYNQAGKEAMNAAIAQGPKPEATVLAVKTIIELGSKVQDRDAIFHATRCFVIASEDAEGNAVKKWIFAIMRHRQLHQTFETLRGNGGGRAVGLQFERDAAPRSQAATKVEKLAFREGKGAKGKRRAKRQKNLR